MSALLGALVAFPALIASLLIGSVIFPESATQSTWTGLGVFAIVSILVIACRRRQPSFWLAYIIATIVVVLVFLFVEGIAG